MVGFRGKKIREFIDRHIMILFTVMLIIVVIILNIIDI